jgi:hypothetical protein
MLEWHDIFLLLAAVAVIAFAIFYAKDRRNASKDEPARDDRDNVKIGKSKVSRAKDQSF